MKNKTKIPYVDNKKFFNELVKYNKACRKAQREKREKPRIPDYIGECIYKIADNLSHKPSFINYSFRDEMIDDGIENCFLYMHNFDTKKSNNPFSYFTTIIKYAFIRRIAKEEKIRYTTYKYFQETMINTGIADFGVDNSELSENSNLLPKQMYDNINTFMKRFEEKEDIKKEKRNKLKGLQKFYTEGK